MLFEDSYKLEEPNRLYHDVMYFYTVYDSFYHDGRQEGIDERNNFEEKKYKSGDTNKELTHRILGHWDKLGYFIPNPQESKISDKKQWKKYSTGDLLWTEVLLKLRNFGMSSEQLLEAAKCVYYIGKDEKPESYRNSMDVAAYMCKQNIAMFAAVYEDGWLEIANWGDIVFSMEKNITKHKNLVLICLNECMRNLFPDGDYKELKGVGVTDQEKAILEALRADSIREIKVTKKTNNGKDTLSISTVKKESIKKGEDSKKLDPLSNMLTQIRKMEFGEVSVKVQKGHPEMIEITHKSQRNK